MAKAAAHYIYQLRPARAVEITWPAEISDDARELARRVAYDAYSDGNYAAEILAENLLELRRRVFGS